MRVRAALLAGLFLLAGCGGASLEADDPAGYEACQLYVESRESDDPVLKAALPMSEVGDHASEAETAAIRDAVEPLFSDAERAESGMPKVWSVDHDALAEACEANGVDVP